MSGDSKKRRRKKRDGLRKRCRCGDRRWDGCPHPWHFKIKIPGQAKRHRLILEKHFNVVSPISREEAEALADRARVELRTPTAFDARLTLNAAIDRFEKAYPEKKHYYLRKLREVEVQGSTGVVKLGVKAIADITSDDIEQAAQACQEEAKAGRRGGIDSKRHLLTTARRLFNWAIRQKMSRSTPFRFEGQAMIDVPSSRQRDRRLVGDEEERLMAAADPYTRDLAAAALETGCRGGELRLLQWVDVQGDFLVLTAEKTKTKRRRLIPISPTLKKILDRRRKGPDDKPLPETAYVFGTAVGEPVSRRLANRWWTTTCERAKLNDLHFHDLRHEFGSQLLEAGGELHEVQATLGHTNIKMTSTYLNATTKGVQEAFKKLEAKRRRRSLRVVG